MNISRRSILTGLSLLAAPAVIKIPGLLMPVKALELPEFSFVHDSMFLSSNGTYCFSINLQEGIINLSNDGGIRWTTSKLIDYKIPSLTTV